MQGKLTKKISKNIDKLKDIIICPRVLKLLQPKCAVLCSTFNSHPKKLLCSQRRTEIIYANTQCGYIYSYMCEYMHTCVYLLWWCGYIGAVLAVNIVPWWWWSNTQSSQLWSCATKSSAMLILADHLIMIVHVSTPGETVPYAHLIRYMMFSAHVIIKRSCTICLSDQSMIDQICRAQTMMTKITQMFSGHVITKSCRAMRFVLDCASRQAWDARLYPKYMF